MKPRDELIRLLNTVRGSNLGGLKSAHARGLPYYGSLPLEYPRHFASFKRMHSRAARSGLEVAFPRSGHGFVKFLLYVGDIPKGMVQPSLGRKDHSKGYVPKNFGWQSYSDNSSESASRNLKSRNQNMAPIRANMTRIANRDKLAKLVSKRGVLSDTQCMRITGNRNVQTYNLVSGMIRSGKLSAEIVGSRTYGWKVRKI